MKVGEYVRVLRDARVYGVTEETVRKNVVELLRVLSGEELNILVQRAVVEENDWLAKTATIELLRRKKIVRVVMR